MAMMSARLNLQCRKIAVRSIEIKKKLINEEQNARTLSEDTTTYLETQSLILLTLPVKNTSLRYIMPLC